MTCAAGHTDAFEATRTCRSAAGVQKISAKITRDAAVSVSAIPAAVMPSSATRTVGSVWKRFTRSWRSRGMVVPSIRIVDTFASVSLAIASSTARWCANTINFPG